MTLNKQKNLQNEGERLKYIEDMLEAIARLESIEQEHYLKQLSNEFNLSFQVLHQEMMRKERKLRRRVSNSRLNGIKTRLNLITHFKRLVQLLPTLKQNECFSGICYKTKK